MYRMNTKRNTTIDFMRGLAVLLIILIHVTVYFRNNKIASVLWEYSQVAVPIFVFCSAYLYFSKTKQEQLSVAYFWRRIKRLVIPYYAFLLFLFAYTLFFKNVSMQLQPMMKRIFFLNMSSNDIDWLVVLFLYFMILMPLIRILSYKPILFWIFTTISCISAIALLFTDSTLYFRLVMWLPWSLVLIVTYLVVRYESKKWFLPAIITTFLSLYIASRAFLLYSGDTLTLTENKYPPNIYYLSYGIFLMLLLYSIYKKYSSKIGFIQKYFDYFSTYSYSLFFIHFLILYYFLDFTEYEKMQWWGLFGIIIIISVVAQSILNRIQAFTSSQY